MSKTLGLPPLALATLALAAPALLALGAPPLASMHTEALALLGWGAWMAWLARLNGGACQAGLFGRSQPELRMAAVGLAAIALAAAASAAALSLPGPIAARDSTVLIAAGLALATGAAAAQPGRGHNATIHAVLWALLIAGLGNACIGALQYLQVRGFWQPLGRDGRASGHLGQPNLYATQLLWALVALAALREQGRIGVWTTRACATMLIVGVALSASRTGFASAIVLFGWGLADRRLGRPTRALLMCTPLALAAAWWALERLHGVGGPAFAGTELLQKSDPTSSRWVLWQQCALLVREHPWFGVGWHQFNFAWTLTPMPPDLPRTVGYPFTHAHNLGLHWAVELGLPLTLMLVALFGAALLCAMKRLRSDPGPDAVFQRAALVAVTVVLVHSQLEYPLWYVHFLLPTAFLLGAGLVRKNAGSVPDAPAPHASLPGLAVALAAALALFDYQPVSDLYVPPPQAASEETRIAAARRSLLYGHFGDRLHGTLLAGDGADPRLYRGQAFEMLDPRLMAAWARALAQAGRQEHALSLLARLREFELGMGHPAFTHCGGEPKPLRCIDVDPRLPFQDFR